MSNCEIARKSAELSAVSSKLADMASQRNRLRQLNGRIGFFTDRNGRSSRRKNDSYTSRRCLGITDAGRCERRSERGVQLSCYFQPFQLADSIIEVVQPSFAPSRFRLHSPSVGWCQQFRARRTHRFHCRLTLPPWKVRHRLAAQGRRVRTLTRSTPVRRPRSLAEPSSGPHGDHSLRTGF
jgi:hypothetical protein